MRKRKNVDENSFFLRFFFICLSTWYGVIFYSSLPFIPFFFSSGFGFVTYERTKMKKKLIKGTILLFFNSDPKLAIRLSKYNYIYRKTIISEIRALAMALDLGWRSG